MYRTEFTQKNADFSNIAHISAQENIYPLVFKTKALSFESTLLGTSDKNTVLDGEMAVDRLVHVTVKGLHAPIEFTVQERFRRMNYAKYRDLTITEWNHNSNLPSELYKLNAGLFVYGYFDETKKTFGEVIVIDTTRLLFNLVTGQLKYQIRHNRKNQSFFCFRFDDLEETIIFHGHNPIRHWQPSFI